MGLSPAEFWDMPPTLFNLKVEGYFQRENRAGYYYRESYALLYNINRGEKTPAIDGKDVLSLPLEKKQRQARKRGTIWTQQEIDRIRALHNMPATQPPLD